MFCDWLKETSASGIGTKVKGMRFKGHYIHFQPILLVLINVHYKMGLLLSTDLLSRSAVVRSETYHR